MLRILRQVSYPQLRQSWGRTAMVVGGIATGVALMVAINISNTSVLESFRRSIASIAGPADLEVILGFGEVGFDESVLEIVRKDPDVETAVPLVRGTIQPTSHPNEEALQLYGVDLTAEDDFRRYEVTMTSDRKEASMAVLDVHSILLTSVFANEHGVNVGDAIEVSTPRGVEKFTVRGLLEPTGLAAAFGGRLAIMDIATAQLVFSKERRIDQVDVNLRRGADRDTVQRRLAAAVPSGLTVQPPAQRAAQYEGVLAAVQAMHTGISTLCLIAGTYIVYNTTSTGAVQRARVLAGLRVIGAEGSQVLRLLVAEALLLGFVGTALGVGLGFALSLLLIRRVPDGLGIIFQLRFPVDTLAIDPAEHVVIALVGIFACFVASYAVARRVASLDPLEVLRVGVRLERVGHLRPGRLAALALVIIALSAAAFAAEVSLKSFAWGNVGSTLWNASAIVVAVPFVSVVGGAVARALRALFPAEGPIAADSLLRSPTRTGVTVAAVSLMLAASITLATLSTSFQRSMDDYLGVALAGDVVVSAVSTEGGWLESPMADAVMDELDDIPGVHALEAVRVVPGQMFRGQRIALIAMSDGLLEPARLPDGWYREGEPHDAAARVRAGKAVNISTSLSDRFDLHAGDSVELLTPTGPLTLPIAGVQPDYASDRGTVMLSRTLFLDRWKERTISRVIMTLAPGTDVDAVKADVLARVGERHRVKVQTLGEALGYIKGKITEAFAFTNAIQLLIAIVTIAGVFDLLLSAIAERRRELAVWRVIGADERTVRRSVTLESATIGGMGILLGIVFGLVTSWLWVEVNYRYLLGFFLEFHPALASMAVSALLVSVMTVVAGYGAARAATRQSIIEAAQRE